MKTISAVTAAGDTHPGLQRAVNEDRFHVDVARGLFIVVDGVGGQAAGGKAADLAMRMLRARLERETGPVGDRIREAITIANNEIRHAASLRPEWHGMACVLTVVVVDDGRAVVGHVGDTRLYKLDRGRIEKATRDHSPVGEREDACEISETDAMRHPRRNEVYRDVGSELHDALDDDFIDLFEIPFEPDAALLLCSDGLTDLIDSTAVREIVARFAGRPHQVVKGLIEAANDAGGKDNVTVVYVEGEQFANQVARRRDVTNERRPAAASQHAVEPPSATSGVLNNAGRRRSRRIVRIALIALLAIVVGYAVYRDDLRIPLLRAPIVATTSKAVEPIVVTPSESISSAIASARPGGSVVVEPGEYRERLILSEGVRVISRVPRGATIRLPGSASEGDPAVVADGVSGAELIGFRIVGDAATPLGTGIFAKNADVLIVDVEISGAASVAVDLTDAARLSLLASHIHDNPGAGLAIRGSSSPRVNQNLFARNGLSERVGTALIVEAETQPTLFGNVFQGVGVDAFRALGDASAARIARDNFFNTTPEPTTRPSNAPPNRRGR